MNSQNVKDNTDFIKAIDRFYMDSRSEFCPFCNSEKSDFLFGCGCVFSNPCSLTGLDFEGVFIEE